MAGGVEVRWRAVGQEADLKWWSGLIEWMKTWNWLNGADENMRLHWEAGNHVGIVMSIFSVWAIPWGVQGRHHGPNRLGTRDRVWDTVFLITRFVRANSSPIRINTLDLLALSRSVYTSLSFPRRLAPSTGVATLWRRAWWSTTGQLSAAWTPPPPSSTWSRASSRSATPHKRPYPHLWGKPSLIGEYCLWCAARWGGVVSGNTST